jgi:hypothetical protein
MIQRFAIHLFLMLVAGAPVQSAELFYMDHDAYTGKYIGPVGPLVLSGDIIRGDYDRLLSKISEDKNRFLLLNKIVLASSDGDVREAMKIADLVKALRSEVSVGPLTGKCVGACFLIYAAAGQRVTDGELLIGITRPEGVESEPIAPTVVDANAGAVSDQTEVRDFLKENEVPGYLSDEMFRHEPGEAYWLSARDEANLKPKSPAFARYLIAKCAWDETVEQEANSGKRPFADMNTMWACRTRVTQIDARKALAAALKEKPARR